MHMQIHINRGRVSNTKSVCTTELQLINSTNNRIDKKTNSSNSKPSNALRMLRTFEWSDREVY